MNELTEILNVHEQLTTAPAEPPERPAADRVEEILRRGLHRLTWTEVNELWTTALAAGMDPLQRFGDEARSLQVWPRKEVDARDHFALQMNGQTEIGVAFGRADVFIPGVVGTPMVVEVEPYTSYPNGVRQALAYARMTDRLPAVAVYGDLSGRQARSLATRLKGWVDLFLLDGDWQWIPDPSWAEAHPWSGRMWKGMPGPTVTKWWQSMQQQRREEIR